MSNQEALRCLLSCQCPATLPGAARLHRQHSGFRAWKGDCPVAEGTARRTKQDWCTTQLQQGHLTTCVEDFACHIYARHMLIQTLVRFEINCAEFGKTGQHVLLFFIQTQTVSKKCFEKVVASRRKKRSSKSWRRPGHARNHPNGARFKSVLQPSRFERQLCLYYMKIMLRPRPPWGSTSEPEVAPWQWCSPEWIRFWRPIDTDGLDLLRLELVEPYLCKPTMEVCIHLLPDDTLAGCLSRLWGNGPPAPVTNQGLGWDSLYMGVSKNSGFPPKSSILIRFSIINHPFWGTPIFGNIHILKL